MGKEEDQLIYKLTAVICKGPIGYEEVIG